MTRNEMQERLEKPQKPVPNPEYEPGPNWDGPIGVISAAVFFLPPLALLMATGFSMITFTVGGGWLAFWVYLVARRIARRL